MSGPPGYPPVLLPRRSATGLVCVLIGVASFVLALAVGGQTNDDSRAAALDRDARSQSASAASSSRSVAASLPSVAEVRARFPRPPGTITKPGSPPSGGFTFYFSRGLTYEQVKAFYEKAIPRTFPTLQCRFDYDVPVDGPKIGEECQLRTDVDFGQVDVWFKVDGLRRGEIFIRLDIGS